MMLMVVGGLCSHPVKHRDRRVIFGLVKDCITAVVSEGWSLIDRSWMLTVAQCPVRYSIPAVPYMSAGGVCRNLSGPVYTSSTPWSSIQGT